MTTALISVATYLLIGCCIAPWYIRRIRKAHDQVAAEEVIPQKAVRITLEVMIPLWPFVVLYDLATHFERWKRSIYEAMQDG